MRAWIGAAAALLGACSVEVDSERAEGGGEAAPGGYSMQIVASEQGQIYLVTGPSEQLAAARVDNGVSTLMDAAEARLAVGEARAAAADLGPAPEVISIRAPGFEMTINAEEDQGGEDGRAQVSISTGGREVSVDASGEDQTGQAVVRITGASESDARDFIDGAEELSADTKQQMRAALGL